jgi:uncharacterized membrane protein
VLFLIIGLVLFLGSHSVRIFADDWRSARITAMGEGAWKGVYSLVSLVGLGLMVWGYGLAREAPVDLWHPPRGLSHLTALLMVPSFVLLAAAYVPGNHLKAAIGHPMVAGVKLWALAHLLSNGRLADVVLFGALLAWAVADFAAARRRDRARRTPRPSATAGSTLVAVAVGLIAWAAFAFHLHASLIGVQPLG